MHSILDNAYKKAKPVTINCDTKLIFFSDVHKGDNSYADDFTHNMEIYTHAIQQYYDQDYTYIELGDGIELWENYSSIKHIRMFLNCSNSFMKRIAYTCYGVIMT